MKRNIIAFILLALSTAVDAQLASWLIPPVYDDINKVIGADLIVTDSLKKKTLWTYQGKRLFDTKESLFSFSDDVAVLTKNGTNALLGILTVRGHFIPLNGLLVVHKYPYFSDGFLAVKQENGRYYHYLDVTGTEAIQNCTSAYPFSNGFGKCETFQGSKRKNGCVHMLLDTDGEPVSFSFNGKKFHDSEIDFISSVNDEGLAVVVANLKVYFFEAASRSLRPVFANEGDSDLKNQAQVENDETKFLRKFGEDGMELIAKSGGAKVSFRFNSLLKPVEFIVNGTSKAYKDKKERELWDPQTSLEITAENDRYGIYYNGKEVLPPQFVDCPTCFENKAFAGVSGKYGLLQVSNSGKFEFSMNKGNDIAFRHQRVESTIRLDIPFPVAEKSMSIRMDPNSGCELDMTSRVAKTASFGSSVIYYCTLTIPDRLSDETKDIRYKAQAVYDGLVSAPVEFKAKQWYYKYFNIDVDDVETVINNGNLFFTFNVSADKVPGEEDYPCTVSVKSGNLPVNLDKISETRYKCSVTNLKDGVNQVIIQIQEPGCPRTEYPFEVTYTKPVPKTASKAAVKEKVVIKNNSKPRRQAPPPPAKETKRPRLEI